jgi:hypothetical protein
MIINPAIKKLPVGASNQAMLRLASFKRRFVESVQMLANKDNTRKDNNPLNEKTALKIANNK